MSAVDFAGTGHASPGGAGRAIANRIVRVGNLRMLGYLSILAMFGGFGYWAATAPLSGAVIAAGQIASLDRNQTIQHLEGGIIRQVHVAEGDRVSKGDPLFTMDDTFARSESQRIARQIITLKAQLTRQAAERDQIETLTFPAELREGAAALGMTSALDEQYKEFEARRSRIASEDQILNQRIAALRDSLEGYKAQEAAISEQIGVVSEEMERKKKLLDRGLTNRSEYTELLRANANLVGQRGSIAAQIASTNTQIVESQEQVVRNRTSAVEQALVQSNETLLKLTDLEERFTAQEAILDRTVVRSPTDGYVIRLLANSPGAVLSAGGQLAEVLPTSSELVVSARLNVTDIDRVALGQDAQLQFSALNQRTTPNVPGTVIFVSPDSIYDEKSGISFYAARLRINELPPEVKPEQIYPGMPVSALISTPERTFFEYLARPIMDSLQLAFREQ